ncbi:MAG: radical SAM protein [Oscillospiraceae bacterium]|nr:radical SAM protein [Oscillospiraceae bacterium]
MRRSDILTHCTLCPRRCGVDRTVSKGFCGEDAGIRAAKAYLHMWEEPCISGTNGSGTVFFTGCPLKCVFCQNYAISQQGTGKELTVRELADVFLRLQYSGAHNINLVTATHFVPQILDALDMCKDELTVPVVYNSGGYELTETIDMLKGYVDIFIPDLKYFSPEVSGKYSAAADYYKYAEKAVRHMVKTAGRPVFDENGLLKSGVIVRHMILPSHRRDSDALLRSIADLKDDILLSLMSQYTPFFRAHEFHEIDRRIYTHEYRKVLDTVNETGFEGYSQERSSAREEYTPDFDMQGL